jgi:hypothetical protein
MPDVGEPDAPLDIDPTAARRIADWYTLAWIVIDEFVTSLRPESEPVTTQLWPEHFDAATNVAIASGERVNLGFSPGDGYDPEPYLYVGPWSAERRGDPAFWNAPFGAVLSAADLAGASDPAQSCIEFLRAGMKNASA